MFDYNNNINLFSDIYGFASIEEFRLTLPGPIPSNIPGKAYSAWNKKTLDLIGLTPGRPPTIRKAVCVMIFFFFESNQRRALTNASDSIFDTLVDAKIIKDDRWAVTGDVLLFPSGIDKKNPRAEISIFYKDQENEKE
ncbi:MAG TPA: hypothetical protein PLB05_08695 [Candidatus Omnitrophota bacterium]|nr:hypothetical protein [Candidatus Omnitrophota bacterium]